MSRIGKQPVQVPSGVTVTVTGQKVAVKGPKGELELSLPLGIDAVVDGGTVVVTRQREDRRHLSLHGLSRSLVANLVEGVTKGYRKDLQIEGVGFRATVQGNKLSIALGFASPIEYKIPAGVSVTEEGGTKVAVQGASKQLVGNVAARIRSFYPAEPYKGKGVKYAGEQIRRKEGKTVG